LSLDDIRMTPRHRLICRGYAEESYIDVPIA
jgi:hypothetical protein